MFALLVILRSAAKWIKCIDTRHHGCDCSRYYFSGDNHTAEGKCENWVAPESTVKRDYTYCTETHIHTPQTLRWDPSYLHKPLLINEKAFPFRTDTPTQLM